MWARGDVCERMSAMPELSPSRREFGTNPKRHAVREVFETGVCLMLPIPDEVGMIGVSVDPHFPYHLS